MRPSARTGTAVVVALGALFVLFTPRMHEASPEVVNVELSGICGTLVGGGVTAASMGRTVAAKGAGWVGAIIAAGCLWRDLDEYTKKYQLSPEGRAELRAIQRKYGHYTFDDYMREFDCKYEEHQIANPDDITETKTGRWICPTTTD